MARFRIILLCGAMLLCVAIQARVGIYSDSRDGDAIHARIVASIASHNPMAVFHGGDLCATGTRQAEYDSFLLAVSPLDSSTEFFPTRGNHDKDKALFLKNFPQCGGSAYYSVTRDSIRWVVLDSNESLKPKSEQYRWLESTLQAETGLSLIVLMHHPVFSSGAHGSTPGLSLYLPPLFEEYGVKAVFSGHDHSYEHSEFNGIHYIVSGGGGSPLRDTRQPNPYSQLFANTHHYIILDMEGGALQVQAFALDGSKLHSLRIPLR